MVYLWLVVSPQDLEYASFCEEHQVVLNVLVEVYGAYILPDTKDEHTKCKDVEDRYLEHLELVLQPEVTYNVVYDEQDSNEVNHKQDIYFDLEPLNLLRCGYLVAWWYIRQWSDMFWVHF